MKRRKNPMTKKLMALCLTMLFVFSMSLNALAAIQADSKGTVTITGLTSDNGAEIKAYKIIGINFNADNQQLEEPVYTWEDSVAKWVKESYANYIHADNTVSDQYMKASGSELKTFYDAMNEAGVLTSAVATTTMSNQTAAMQLPMGQYVISATKDGKIYSLITANIYPVYDENKGWFIEDVTVALKGSAPGIDKTVDPNGEGETDKTVSIGDIVPYVIKADIPVYPEDAVGKIFKIGDTLSAGLTLDRNSIRVLAGETELTLGREYAIEFDLTDPARTFEITFDYDTLKAVGNATSVTVKYRAVVNENAFDVDDLGNSAFAGYQTDPYDENSYTPGDGDKENIYTYGIDLTKMDKMDKQALAGAEFELRDDAEKDAITFVEVGAGIYRPTKSDESGVTTLKASENGKLQIQGLDVGIYYLRETKAPEGYVVPNKDIVIVLKDNEPDGTLDNSQVTIEESDVASVDGVKISSKGNTIQFNLYNTSSKDEGFVLPTTGGAGTLIFSVIGIGLMGAAVAMIIIGKRKQSR